MISAPAARGTLLVTRRSPDWTRAPWGYRAIKDVFHYPVKWAMRIRATGWETFPRRGGVVVAPNHYSWADPIAVQAVLARPGYYLGKHSLFKGRIGGWFFPAMGMVPVDRASGGNEAALQAAVRIVEAGLVAGIFPEGTRSVHPDLLPFKTGAVRVALMTGAPIVPAACLTDRFWPKGKTLPRFGRRTFVAFGEPYVLGKDPELASDKDYCRKASDDLQTRVRSLLSQCELARAENRRWRYR